jgi:hypothetical protein
LKRACAEIQTRDCFEIHEYERKTDKAGCKMRHFSMHGCALVLMASLSACGGGGDASAVIAEPTAKCIMSTAAPTPEVTGTRVLLQVKPSAASSCISKKDEPHQVYRDNAAANKALLAVFLPGTGGAPAQFPAFLQQGALRGYHVIGLTYTNDESVTVLCNAAGGNADCAGSIRNEILTGRDDSSLVTVSNVDSIEARLSDLLKYLNFHRPADGWGQFLSPAGTVAWDKIVVSGNSQGAGHAAYIAKVRRVNRVGVYAGPSDWVNAANAPVNWYRLSSLTPAAAYFGFIHAPDTLANSSGNPTQATDVWRDLFGMAGELTNVQSTAAPYGGSQRLFTTACAGSGTVNEHNCPMMRGNEATWNVVSYP